MAAEAETKNEHRQHHAEGKQQQVEQRGDQVAVHHHRDQRQRGRAAREAVHDADHHRRVPLQPITLGFAGVSAAFDLPVPMHDLAVAMLGEADALPPETPQAHETHDDQECADKQFGQLRE